MESSIKTWALVSSAALVASCTTTAPQTTDAEPAARPNVLAVQQVGNGPSSRFVYCAVDECHPLTPKTAPTPRSNVALTPTSVAPQQRPTNAPAFWTSDVDIPFQFNGTHVETVDRDRIAMVALRAKSNLVLITARSDFVGPPAQQQRIAAARAMALRKVIAATVSPKARIVESLEIAEPNAVTAQHQASQRRGTVRFVVQPSTNL